MSLQPVNWWLRRRCLMILRKYRRWIDQTILDTAPWCPWQKGVKSGRFSQYVRAKLDRSLCSRHRWLILHRMLSGWAVPILAIEATVPFVRSSSFWSPRVFGFVLDWQRRWNRIWMCLRSTFRVSHQSFELEQPLGGLKFNVTVEDTNNFSNFSNRLGIEVQT